MNVDSICNSEGLNIKPNPANNAPDPVIPTAAGKVSTPEGESVAKCKSDKKPAGKGSNAPIIGLAPNIEDRNGRMQVHTDIIKRWYDTGIGTNDALKSLDKLSEYYGDKEAMEAERNKVPIETVIAHLIQCEIEGRNPVKAEMQELARAVCRAFDLDIATLTRGNASATHKTKGKDPRTHGLNTDKQGPSAHDVVHSVCNDAQSAPATEDSCEPSRDPFNDTIHSKRSTKRHPPAQIQQHISPSSLTPLPSGVVPKTPENIDKKVDLKGKKIEKKSESATDEEKSAVAKWMRGEM